MAIRLPTRLPVHHPAQRWVAAAVIAAAATLVVVLLRAAPVTRDAAARADFLLYDALYHVRPHEDMTNREVVILAVDQTSLDEAERGVIDENSFGWPWPRWTWARLIEYLQHAGAKGVAFDVLFNNKSAHQERIGDDEEFGKAIDAAKMPVVFASFVGEDGRPGRFAPQAARAVFGAANYGSERTVRTYQPVVQGVPSLALRAATFAGGPGAGAEEPFLLHFYGPSSPGAARPTFRCIPASHVVAAAADWAQHLEPRQDYKFDPELFRDKIVLVGLTADGLLDLKSSPLSLQYPGVEAQATAVENLLHGQRVRPFGGGVLALAAAGFSLLAGLGVSLPRQTTAKLAAAAGAVAVLVALAVLLFRGQTIRWLPLATPLLAVLLTTVVAFAWTYLTEDRTRQLLFRALSQNMSPELAARVLQDPEFLNRLGGDRREMTVMFTDIAGFTDLSESMDVEKLTALMNFYLEEMSSVVISGQAYLDKYIGDAIMSFWNGVPDQSDHAVLACRAALAMQERERQMQPDLRRLGAQNLLTRIGINSGPMNLGNMGSSRKFAFTVLGDSVNLGSRLEGANKIYGSQILIAHTTAEQVKDRFVLRQLDLLRVKGKKIPMAVYELMAEAPADATLTKRVERYEAALRLFQKQQWDAAEAELQALLDEFPDDAPAAALHKRIEKLRHDPPPADWDGVYVAKDK